MLESEMWQPGKVISNKINTNHTYLATTNYWAPLHKAEEDSAANCKHKVKQMDTLDRETMYDEISN